MNPYGNSFTRIVPGIVMALKKQLSSGSKRSLHHLKSLHITTPTVTAADVPPTGLGAVILHTQDNGQCLPICYISRSLSDAEGSYAVMEKEVLASTWACKRLEEYYFGLRLNLETDQKPLAPLLTTTNLSKVPPQILPLPLRMMRYNPKPLHIPGKC